LQQLSWDPPDWIIFPAGNLGNTAAFGKALREARGWGLIQGMPRLAAVQAAGAAPFARSFAEGFVKPHRVKAETVATAIRIGNPASYERAVVAIRETNGLVLSVTDAELLEAKAAIDASGVGCEPASAVSLAGLRKLVRSGEVKPDERVIAILTGHILKDPDLLLHYHQEMNPPPPGANRPIEIEPNLQEIQRVLESEK
jgi:threonine synthase